MSKSQILRALVNERLTAAAEEIFALFERTIAEYEEEVCRSKEENQRKQELLDSMLSPSKSPGSGLDQDPPQTPRIKEEPEEPSVKQEEHTLLVQVSVGVPESSAVCVMTEESSLLQQRQTELREETQGEDISPKPHLHSSDTDNNEDWRAPLSCSAAQMETDADGELYNQVQKGQRLRALVKEIFVLFERTIAEYEEEVCRSKEKNQRRQELLDSMLSPSKSPGPSLDQDPPQTQWIKEEPEELSVQQEEHTHLVQGEDISAEPHLHSETEGDTEHSSDTDDEDWRTLFNCAAAQMETDADGDHYNQFQNSDLSLKYKSAPETSATVNKEDMSGTAEGAEGKKHQCFVCQKRFGTSRNLQRHSIIHTGEKPFSCSTCQKTFNRKANLGTHEKIHAKKLFSCSTCKRSFTTKSNLEKHAKIHLGERLYSCLICEKTFAYKSDLNKHVRTHTGERPYSCPRCEKTFSRKDILDVHERTHTGEKPYSCSTCERSFSHKCNFVKHVRTHTGERPYSCSTCERSFSQKSNLVKHVRTHTGERPYSCLVCEKTFSENSSLTKHVRTHTGEKPYSCSMCEKTFSDSSYFIKHVRMHTGERPYSCSTCEKSFALKSNLDKHVRTHTGERPYSCSICNKGFTRVYDLNMHMRIHRKECD